MPYLVEGDSHVLQTVAGHSLCFSCGTCFCVLVFRWPHLLHQLSRQQSLLPSNELEAERRPLAQPVWDLPTPVACGKGAVPQSMCLDGWESMKWFRPDLLGASITQCYTSCVTLLAWSREVAYRRIDPLEDPYTRSFIRNERGTSGAGTHHLKWAGQHKQGSGLERLARNQRMAL